MKRVSYLDCLTSLGGIILAILGALFGFGLYEVLASFNYEWRGLAAFFVGFTFYLAGAYGMYQKINGTK